MSKLLKSKLFFGVMLVAVLVVGGVVAVDANDAAALDCSINSTLRVGSVGTEVSCLQTTLGILADGKFGPMTKASVMAWQASKGLVADGVFGPMSRAAWMVGAPVAGLPAGCSSTAGYSATTGVKCDSAVSGLPAGCTSTMGYSPTTGAKCDSSTGGGSSTPGTLSGEGSVKDFSIGSAEESDVSEGQSGVELIAIDIELEDDGSLKLDRFDLYMGELNGGTESSKPWDYFKSVKLLADGKEIADMDVDSSSDWSEYDTGTLATTAQEYRLRFTGLNAILPSDETTSLTVEFDIVSNLDSDDESATWYFGTETDSFRFEDGTGFIFTDGENLEDTFTFDTAVMADLELSESNDDPVASVIQVSDSSDTNGVTLGVFDIEESEGLDVNITEMVVTLAGTDPTVTVKKLYVYNGGTLVGSENVTALAVTFDNIDLDIDGDDTVELTIKADLDDTNSQVRYQDGDTIQIASVNLTEYEDEMGNDDGDFNETGSYASEVHVLYASGIAVEFVSSSATRSVVADEALEFDQGEFKIVFKVSAFDADMRIDRSCKEDDVNAAGQGVEYTITNNTMNSTTCNLSSLSTDTEDTANTYEVDKNTTRTFTLTVNASMVATGGNDDHFAEVALGSINWGIATDDTNANYYTFNLNDFKTTALFLNEF